MGPDTRPLSSPESELAVTFQDSTYRLSKISIKRSHAINEVRFTYSDNTIWYCGKDDGKIDKRQIIFSEGEYLVRVVHEEFVNLSCAGAAIEFHTNKGRKFSYGSYQNGLRTELATQRRTVDAKAGHEIIALEIEMGVLIGTVQQLIPVSLLKTSLPFTPKSWLTIAELSEKESKEGDSNGPRFSHFYDDQKGARKAFLSACFRVDQKELGRCALLIDNMTGAVLESRGGSNNVNRCQLLSQKAGFGYNRDEIEPSMLEVFTKLGHLCMGSKAAFWVFAVVLIMLGISTYLDLEAKLLFGHVLSIESLTTNTTEDAIGSSIIARATCHSNMFIDCFSSLSSAKIGLVLGFLATKVLERVFYVTQVFIHHNAVENRNMEMKMNAFKHVLSLDQAFFDTRSTSDIRDSMDADGMNSLITWNMPYMITLSLRLVMASIFMLRINFVMGCCAIMAVLASRYLVIEPIQKREKLVHKLERKSQIMKNQVMDEAFKMIGTIKTFSTEDIHYEQYRDAQERRSMTTTEKVYLRCSREFVSDIIQAFSIAIILYVMMKAASQNTVLPGDFTGFFFLLQDFHSLNNRIRWHYQHLLRTFPRIERFVDLMDVKAAVTSGTKKPKELAGEIKFENVCFEYPSRPGERVLKNLNLSIQPNKMTALVGDSGAGKSTIGKMILRLYDPTSGKITIDGVDLKQYDLKTLHQKIGVVAQNPGLFQRSIAENIAYGVRDKVSKDDIAQAAKVANCGFVNDFRAGFDTFAGAGGTQISGGQKQRLAIARAAVRKPSLVILDEATSSLDAVNEKEVQEALEQQVMSGKTVLVVAHRLSTVVKADEIICMKDGDVVERGTHTELMKKNGEYANLVQKQIV